jgi:hypothetical protein
MMNGRAVRRRYQRHQQALLSNANAAQAMVDHFALSLSVTAHAPCVPQVPSIQVLDARLLAQGVFPGAELPAEPLETRLLCFSAHWNQPKLGAMGDISMLPPVGRAAAPRRARTER